MHRLVCLFAASAAALATVAPPCRGQETDDGMIYFGDLLDQGVAWIEENTYLDVDALVENLSSGDGWGDFLGEAIEALHADSYELMAAYEPEVRWALEHLDQIEGAEPYADWLRQRLDYYEAAEVYVRPVQKAVPPAARPSRPVSRPVPKPAPAPGRPAPVSVSKPAPPPRPAPHDVDVWSRKLAKRSRPARAEDLVPELKRIFRDEGIPPELVWLAEVESSFNPKARSPVGAAGLFQLMPATARSLGVATDPVDERYDAAKNARGAARYLRALHGRFGSWDLALAAYNAGQGRVSGKLRQSGGSTFDDIAPLLPSETRMYVPKVIATVQLREQVDLRKI